MTDDDKTIEALRRYGWLRPDADGVERMHDTRPPLPPVVDPRDATIAALRAEVERLRDALADEHAKRCAAELDLVGARALLAEQTARAERAESYVSKLKIDVSGFKGTIGEQVDRIHAEMARAEKAEAERDTALAACAEQTARADGLDQQLSAVLAGIKRNTKVMDGDNHLIAVAKAQQARAENLEKALSEIADAMHGPTIQPLADRVRGYVETCARMGDDIAAFQRALAAGPAALRERLQRDDDWHAWIAVGGAADLVEAAQRRAMEEG